MDAMAYQDILDWANPEKADPGKPAVLAPEQPTHKCESLHQGRFSCWGTGDTYFLVDWATKQEVGPPNYSPPSVVVSPFGQVTRIILERPIQEQLSAPTEPTSPLTPRTLQGFVVKAHRADTEEVSPEDE